VAAEQVSLDVLNVFLSIVIGKGFSYVCWTI